MNVVQPAIPIKTTVSTTTTSTTMRSNSNKEEIPAQKPKTAEESKYKEKKIICSVTFNFYIKKLISHILFNLNYFTVEKQDQHYSSNSIKNITTQFVIFNKKNCKEHFRGPN